MKSSIFILLALIACLFALAPIASAQSQTAAPARWISDDAQLVVTYSNYVNDDDNTTAYMTFNLDPTLTTRIGQAREVVLLARWTDSLTADLTFTMRNASITGHTTTYADSIISTSNTGGYKAIVFKDAATNLMAGGYDELKVQTVHRAAGAGTTASRYLKWYLYIVR